jgi:hypothetical protein
MEVDRNSPADNMSELANNNKSSDPNIMSQKIVVDPKYVRSKLFGLVSDITLLVSWNGFCILMIDIAARMIKYRPVLRSTSLPDTGYSINSK